MPEMALDLLGNKYFSFLYTTSLSLVNLQKNPPSKCAWRV
jgi:hypothetical protein